MAYVDLTPSEQVQLQDFMNTLIRPLVGEYARWLEKSNWAKDAYSSTISAILAQLVAGDEIPNQSGLAGTVDITKAEFTTILGILNANLTNDNTEAKRQGYVKFAGAVNIING